MDISQLWSAHPGIIVGTVVAVVAPVIVCCCCCCCSKNNSTPRKYAYRGKRIALNDLESGSLSDLHTKRGYMPVKTDVSDTENENLAPIVSVNQERPITELPCNFYDFIVDRIIPDFNGQRSRHYQFAVVVLLSENDFDDICQTSFTPSDCLEKPILDKRFPIMPRDRADYGNYIIATPISNGYHSEEAIFGLYSVNDSPFSHLWNMYVERNHGAYPKCVLIYSWNLPCSRCTNVIIRSLREEPYNRVSVILAHTRFWDKWESESQLKMNTQKLTCENITVKQVPYPVHLPPA